MRVVIETPFRAVDNSTKKMYTAYARRAVMDSLARGESPIAFHQWFTKFLDDASEAQRETSIMLSQEWMESAELVAVYADHGVSDGMVQGIQFAAHKGIPLVWRYLFKSSQSKLKAISKRSRKPTQSQSLLPT